MKIFLVLLLSCCTIISCNAQNRQPDPTPQAAPAEENQEQETNSSTQNNRIIPAAEQMDQYIPYLSNRNVALVVNHTSLVGKTHLLDTLLSQGIKVLKVFAPEHGFRGVADAGEVVSTTKDERTGLPIVSLYGNTKKPAANDLKGIEIIIFDIQDVGARFYTYISTMHYIMEAAAENSIEVMILDRPNPNGHYVDGPILDTAHRSFVGMHPVPVVHGMTVAEYAQMINGEGWLPDGNQAQLKLILCSGYTHSSKYEVPVRPSPNLPNMNAIYLYPSLCFFEGTIMSVGRGTDRPFQQYGHPQYPDKTYSFTPVSTPGAKQPLYENQLCYGRDALNDLYGLAVNIDRLHMGWLIEAYKSMGSKESFFNNFFVKLAGTNQLKQQIMQGKTEQQIRASWEDGLQNFKKIRSQYLLYEDFE